LLEIARERGADYMIELEWVEGDPMELPFPDASFDRVLSVFGHMFAADHERTAAELRRVCRPGGAIAIASWVAGDSMERMREIADGPEPPADAILWGSETHVRALLGEARFERATLEWPDESVRGDYLVAVIPR
jgi:ubiquinone/menaquinone biosynthesis C-methylase UbiE